MGIVSTADATLVASSQTLTLPAAGYTRYLALAILVAATYWVGLSGPFLFDDYNNIVGNPLLALDERPSGGLWQVLMAGDAGPLKRPISMLSFALNVKFTGLDPFYFKVFNLGIHLLNGWLVFLLARRLLAYADVPDPKCFLALCTSALWLLHPMQLTSVLYVVQRMTSLSATFVLGGLLAYLLARDAARARRERLCWLWLGVPLFTVLAALAKENGVLLILFCLVIESTLLRWRTVDATHSGTPGQFFLLFLVIPLVALAMFLALNPEWLRLAANTRPFDAGERMLTEARVLVLYLKLLVLPAISNLALFYDDFTISRSLFDPPETIWAVLTVTVAASVAVLSRRRTPILAFAILWFLAGHAMESSFILLELVHPHRNYLPYFGPLLLLVVVGHSLLSRRGPLLPAAIAVAVICTLAGTTALRAYQWRNPLDLVGFEVRHRPESSRAHYEMGRLLNIAAERGNQPDLNIEARKYLRRSAELNHYAINGLIGEAILSQDAIPSDVLGMLIQRLRRNPLTPADAIYLKALVACQQKKTCRTPPNQILAVFGATLSQSRLRPRVKADVLTVLGMYYAQQLGDVKACVDVMREAALLTPDDPSRQLNLAQALMMIPDYDATRTALQRAAELDPLGVHRTRFETIERDLSRFVSEARERNAAQDVD